MLKIFRHLKKGEKIAVTFLSLIVLISSFQIGHAFYVQHSSIIPVEGGIYTEGVVGKLAIINPLYVPYGSVTHDLTQLIFSGLTKYDPKTSDIIPDLATYEISESKKEYLFTIKEGAQWHDGTPVTSNDVIFTYQTVINNPDFKGLILNYNDYKGIKVIKVDERRVKFLLEEPDTFFLVKTIVGLLPAHILSFIPVANLEQSSFNQTPIGTGPYQLVSINTGEDYTEATLESFKDYYGKAGNIPTIRIRIFEDYNTLIKRQSDLDAIRNIPRDSIEKVLKKGHLSLIRYHLPQYVAVFMNTQSPILKSKNVRLGLQLATDKKSVIDDLGENEIIDTPFLEIDQANWVYQHSVNKANGALFDAGWKIPEVAKKNLELEISTAANDESKANGTENNEGIDENQNEESAAEKTPEYITSPNGGKDWKTTEGKVTLTGTAPEDTKAIFVNDYQLQKFIPHTKAWSYIASLEFGNLKKGENHYKIYAMDSANQKALIDSIIITQGTTEDFNKIDAARVQQENEKAIDLPIREQGGEKLLLKLITPQQPEHYQTIAGSLKEQWSKVGVELKIHSLEPAEFQAAVFNRDYDLLIFGQNLGYNLDAYPYWHSSQAKKGGYNLSQFKNFIVDSLLEKVRLQYDLASRQKTLSQAQEVISTEVPAIFLYTPTYYFGASEKIQNIRLQNLANISDRYTMIQDWYAKVDRQLNKGTNPLTLAKWLIHQF